MSPRLRVFLVGVTREDAASLRARLTAVTNLDVVGESVLAEVESGAARLPAGIDAVLMSPRAFHRPAAEDEEPMFEQLTAREQSVLELVADGLANRAIAQELDISEHTVKFHLASVFGKLGVSSRTEAVKRGLKLGVIRI